MNELLQTMSNDMGINRFHGETEDSFVYRLCYSALGQWCLRVAQNFSDGVVGTTKHNQTIVLNNLLARFTELFPSLLNRFVNTGSLAVGFTVHIRRVYEETGYLLTDRNNNHNRIANYGRSVQVGNRALFFGIPSTVYNVIGLGIFTDSTAYKVSTKEFLIRDNLTYEEFLKSRFDYIDFYEKDIEVEELEFFDPESNNVPSKSWKKQPKTECTIARKSKTGPFYRVMCDSGIIQFADEPIELQTYDFTSYEYRRLYFALKAYYKEPLKAIITRIDNNYSKMRVGGHLPNREYYYLLLLSWPVKSAFDKTNFLIKNDLLPETAAVLTNIGIKIERGHKKNE